MTVVEYGTAALFLGEAAKGMNGEWFMRRDGDHYYVEGNTLGQWYAYTGDDEGARKTAALMVLMQPVVAQMLADVFKEFSLTETSSASLTSLAEAIISIWSSLEKQSATD